MSVRLPAPRRLGACHTSFPEPSGHVVGYLMAATRLTTDETTTRLADLPGWVLNADALHARHDAPDVPTATRILTEVFAVADEMDHHPDADLRWRRIRWRLTTHDSGGVTQFDIDLATRISRIAAAAGATTMDAPSLAISVGIDTDDPERIAPFWQAALGYTKIVDDAGDVTLTDPLGESPDVWFQLTPWPAADRNRLHLDVFVPGHLVAERRRAVETVGGIPVTDEFAPRWWVYADADGNEVCFVSPQDPPA